MSNVLPAIGSGTMPRRIEISRNLFFVSPRVLVRSPRARCPTPLPEIPVMGQFGCSGGLRPPKTALTERRYNAAIWKLAHYLFLASLDAVRRMRLLSPDNNDNQHAYKNNHQAGKIPGCCRPLQSRRP